MIEEIVKWFVIKRLAELDSQIHAVVDIACNKVSPWVTAHVLGYSNIYHRAYVSFTGYTESEVCAE